MKISILCVDDDPDSLKVLRMSLEEAGYDVLTAESGEEALRLLQTRTAQLIIADLRMPNMNGFELLQEVKKTPRFAKTPVFFVTAVDDYLAVKYGKELGVDAYITKPIEVADLLAQVKEAMGKVNR